MNESRLPVSRWHYPERNVLLGEVYRSGRPPFAPFPHVTNVLDAALCPVACSHFLLRGSEGALVGQFEERRFGTLFHDFVAHLKRRILRGELEIPGDHHRTTEAVIQQEFTEYALKRQFGLSAIGELWRQGTDTWVRRRLETGDLASIKKTDSIVFETWICNSRMTVPLEGGTRHYPIYGLADEVDLTRHLIIERTLKPPLEGKPPLMKDLQVWLLWRALLTLQKDELPRSWRSLDFEGFKLIVETPEEDFEVDKHDLTFPRLVHSAYSWLNDISLSEQPGVMKEAYDNAACSPSAPHPECSHKWFNCFYRSFPYPTSRPEMKRIFRPWYRLLLWERMWESDLWWYQILDLSDSELEELGLITHGTIVESNPNSTEVQVEGGRPRAAGGYDTYTMVTFGTLHCGNRLDVKLLEAHDDRLIVKLQGEDTARTGHALLLQPAAESTSILQPKPAFLLSNTQRGLFGVQKLGVIKEEAAHVSSQVQLLEAVFGVKKVTSRKR